jgi:hypothetical protein
VSLNEVGECLVKRRGVVGARVAVGHGRVLVVGRVSELKRKGGGRDAVGGEENCQRSRLRLRVYPRPRLSLMNSERGFEPDEV